MSKIENKNNENKKFNIGNKIAIIVAFIILVLVFQLVNFTHVNIIEKVGDFIEEQIESIAPTAPVIDGSLNRWEHE